MGMGYSACRTELVTEDFVGEIAPDELENLKSALADEELDLSDFARDTQMDDAPDYGDAIHIAYDELVTKFNAETGLTLELDYHNSEDDGSRYDEVDGMFWTVGGVYTETPAGIKYRDKIHRVGYVQYG